MEITNFKLINFVFFTHWGIYLCLINFNIHAIHLFKMDFNPEYRNRDTRNDKGMWHLWKWSIILTEATLIFESLIVVFFWVLLFPLIDPSTRTPFKIAFDYIDHITPGALILIDMIMNRAPMNNRHLVVLLPLQFAYGLVNIAGSIGLGKPIYPPLDYKKLMGYVSVVFILVVLTGWFTLYTWIIKMRNQKYKEMERGKVRDDSQSLLKHDDAGPIQDRTNDTSQSLVGV